MYLDLLILTPEPVINLLAPNLTLQRQNYRVRQSRLQGLASGLQNGRVKLNMMLVDLLSFNGTRIYATNTPTDVLQLLISACETMRNLRLNNHLYLHQRVKRRKEGRQSGKEAPGARLPSSTSSLDMMATHFSHTIRMSAR